VGFSPEKDKIPKSFNPTNHGSDNLLCALCAFFVNFVVNIEQYDIKKNFHFYKNTLFLILIQMKRFRTTKI
jgi:hypothetical protein